MDDGLVSRELEKVLGYVYRQNRKRKGKISLSLCVDKVYERMINERLI